MGGAGWGRRARPNTALASPCRPPPLPAFLPRWAGRPPPSPGSRCPAHTSPRRWGNTFCPRAARRRTTERRRRRRRRRGRHRRPRRRAPDGRWPPLPQRPGRSRRRPGRGGGSGGTGGVLAGGRAGGAGLSRASDGGAVAGPSAAWPTPRSGAASSCCSSTGPTGPRRATATTNRICLFSFFFSLLEEDLNAKNEKKEKILSFLALVFCIFLFPLSPFKTTTTTTTTTQLVRLSRYDLIIIILKNKDAHF